MINGHYILPQTSLIMIHHIVRMPWTSTVTVSDTITAMKWSLALIKPAHKRKKTDNYNYYATMWG